MKSTFCFTLDVLDDEIFEEEMEDEQSISRIQKLKKINPNLIITPPTSPDDDILPTKFPANNRKSRRVAKGNKFSPYDAENEVVTLDESYDEEKPLSALMKKNKKRNNGTSTARKRPRSIKNSIPEENNDQQNPNLDANKVTGFENSFAAFLKNQSGPATDHK